MSQGAPAAARADARPASRPRRRPPLPLVLASGAIVVAAVLPLVYLVVRAAGGDADAWSVLWRRSTGELLLDTAILVACVTGAAVVLGVSLAWLVVRTDLPFRRAIGVLAALPLVIPSYVAALVLLGAFGPRGLLQQLLSGPFGVERIPDIYGLPGATAALTLSTYPYVYLLASGALRNLDPALEEASRSLGSSRLHSFARVTLPMLRPSLGASALLVALYTLSDFGAVSLMQYDALTRAIFLQYRSLFDRTPAAILGLVLVAVTAVLLVAEARAQRGGRRHRLGPGSARQARTVPLGRWRWPAFAYSSLVVAVCLLVPLAVLGYWLSRLAGLDEAVDFPWGALGSSLLVAAIAAAVAAAASLPIAVLAHRYRSAGTVALERLAYTPNALPGIVVALSLVFFAARYGGPIYQTLGLLVAAYVIRFLPQALAGSSSALGAVDVRLEEAARGLGRTRLQAWATVTVPLARSGILAGAALVFLSTMKELPATLLLRPIGFETLATEVWGDTASGSYSQAALPAILLVVASAPFVLLVVERRAGRGGEIAG